MKVMLFLRGRLDPAWLQVIGLGASWGQSSTHTEGRNGAADGRLGPLRKAVQRWRAKPY
jgi:hypothetical protein